MKKSNRTNSFKYGFTLIELMVAIGIVLFLLTYSLASFKNFQKRQAVLGAVQQYYSMVEIARSSAISGKLGNCPSLTGLSGHRFQATYNANCSCGVGCGCIVLTVSPICGDFSIATAVETTELNPAVEMDNLRGVDFQVLYRGAVDNLPVDDTTFTPYTVTASYGTLGSTDDYAYEFDIEDGGFTTEGDFTP